MHESRSLQPWQMRWRKSRHSNPNGNCVELAELSAERVAIRNSRAPDGPVLVCTRAEIADFFAAARSGQFDDLTRPPARSARNPLR